MRSTIHQAVAMMAIGALLAGTDEPERLTPAEHQRREEEREARMVRDSEMRAARLARNEAIAAHYREERQRRKTLNFNKRLPRSMRVV